MNREFVSFSMILKYWGTFSSGGTYGFELDEEVMVWIHNRRKILVWNSSGESYGLKDC